ncbi:hypothetical protein GGX14DRAFT_596835 [Mycena pura]|uniref:Uncharacterized protein n=1 Tax=Mycena pura TaxID=153505 RepID=A0AAD6Y176_9AGAR|nr:hypothetical protein GGX14DRAFT_596835 [Mycena pura]
MLDNNATGFSESRIPVTPDNLSRLAEDLRCSTLPSSGGRAHTCNHAATRAHAEAGCVAQVPKRSRSATPGTEAGPDYQHSESSLVPTLERQAKRPWYMRGFGWTGQEVAFSPTIVATELDVPLLGPSTAEFTPVVMCTLTRHRSLFKIVMPIKADVPEQLLKEHPNQAYVQSVLCGIHSGFWPWADTHPGEYPESSEATYGGSMSDQHQRFLRDQRDEEVQLERFSPSFGCVLLPGMYSMSEKPPDGDNGWRMMVVVSSGHPAGGGFQWLSPNRRGDQQLSPTGFQI